MAGYIFIIKEHGHPWYNVGYSVNENEEDRIDDLKTGNPRRLIFKYRIYVSNTRGVSAKAKKLLKEDKKIKGSGFSSWWKGPFKNVKNAVDKAAKNPGPSPRRTRRAGEQDFQESQYLYIIQEFPGYWYKVGKSINPQDRLKELQGDNPRQLKLKYSDEVSDMDDAEEEAHRLLGEDCEPSDAYEGSEWWRMRYSAVEERVKQAVEMYPPRG